MCHSSCCCCCCCGGSKAAEKSRRVETHEDEARKESARFITKVLAVKAMQFAVEAGYFAFVTRPAYMFISIFVTLKKTPPYFATTLILILVSSISFGYVLGMAILYEGMNIVSLPLTILLVNIAYIILLPLFAARKMTKEMSLKTYMIIPMMIIWAENVLLLGAVAMLPSKTEFYHFYNRLEMLMVVCLPTLMGSTFAIGVIFTKYLSTIHTKYADEVLASLWYQSDVAPLFLCNIVFNVPATISYQRTMLPDCVGETL